MSDDLDFTALRDHLVKFSRRKNDLSEAGTQALARLTFNLKIYEQAKAREHEHLDNARVIKVLGEQNDIDIAILQADLARKR